MIGRRHIALILTGTAVLAFAGLWFHASGENDRLRLELDEAKTDLAFTTRRLSTLEASNLKLRSRFQNFPEFSDASSETSSRDVAPEEDGIVPPAEKQTSNTTPSIPESVEPVRTQTPEEEAAQQAEREEREQRREEWRERRDAYRLQMVNDLQDRREFFSVMSLEGLSPEYAEANVRLIEAMGEMQAGLAALSDSDLDREGRRNLQRSLRQTRREVDELMGLQKDILLFDYAESQLRLDDTQTREFLDYMRSVDAYTTFPDFGGSGRRDSR